MAAEAEKPGWNGVSRRGLPRFPMQAALDVTVLRSGIPDTVPGRSLNVCEQGIAAILAQELVPGEAVAVEVQLSQLTAPVRARAIVRHQDKLCSGLEFVGLPAEQREAIRNWTREANAGKKFDANPTVTATLPAAPTKAEKRRTMSGGAPPPGKKRFTAAWILVLLIAAFALALLWGRWNRGWEELESVQKNSETAPTAAKQIQVPAEVMERLLIHRVAPAYPAEARKQKLQGIIALDIVVGRDGTVVSMQPLNGPDVLAHAAMDALRWWKFEPYRVNGEPEAVETRVAVEFKR
ncbi:MAG TPA: TonB family protein [Candidatus Sulfotelmatobacter sp.]|nr:TonB family protein [Candidatus Sulfotelmatobacter sp.]